MKFNVLVAPAHYIFSDVIKSEIAWSYALVKHLSPHVESMDVLTGIKDLSLALFPNTRVFSLFPHRSALVSIEFIRRILFYPLITLQALRLMSEKRYLIVHHMLPLSYATVNPLVFITKIFFPKSKVILGPLQLPQMAGDQQDLNVVFSGKPEYSISSKVVYKLTMTIISLVKPLAVKMFESADLVVCNSKTSLKFYSSMFPKAKFSVIYTGLDIENLVPTKAKVGTQKLKILCAGVFSKRKGQIFLLKAMLNLVKKYPNVTLTLIGGGDQDRVYRDFVKENRMEKYVTFTGQIPYTDLLKAYKNHDIFCLPTLSDTSPYVILEAMSYGLPIVATDIGSIEEMAGDAGKIVKPQSSESLEVALSDLIVNSKLRSVMSKNGPIRVKRYFTWDKIHKQWLKAYQKLVT